MLDINLSDLPISTKTIREKQIQVFKENLPDALFHTTYELQNISDIPAKQWEDFLAIEEVQHFIKNSQKSYLKQAAMGALFRLSKGVHSTEVAALKQLIEQSGILNVEESNQQVVISRIPGKERQT